MKGIFTVSSSVPTDGSFIFVIADKDGNEIGELHLKRSLPLIPSQYAGELYLWDTADVQEVNKIEHLTAVKRSALDRVMDRAMRIHPSELKPEAPRGTNLGEWRQYFKKGGDQ